MSKKICSKCKIEKDLKEFRNKKASKDGKRTQCRQCMNKTDAAWYRKNAAYKKEYQSSKWKDPMGKRVRQLSHRKWYLHGGKEKMNKNHKHWQYGTVGGKYNKYIWSAKRRNLLFELTFEQFAQYWQKPCSYCGSTIDTIGLDRIDNSKGYVSGNIASCCTFCNIIKRTMSKDEFLEHCKKIVNHSLPHLTI